MNTPVSLIKKVLSELDNRIYPEDENFIKVPCLVREEDEYFIFQFFFSRDDKTREWNLQGIDKQIYT